MPASEKKLAVAAMGLPRKKRAKLAGLLLESLETKKEQGISEAWADEAGARARVSPGQDQGTAGGKSSGLQIVRIKALEVARREFDEAFLYYERQRAGLGEEIRALVMKRRDFPDAWTLMRPGIRKCLGQRFPYDVIHQKSADLLLVLALAHRRRRARYWEDRLSHA